MILLGRQIAEGEYLPRGYGVVYVNHYSRTFVAYPFPLNWIVGSMRELWFKIRNKPISDMDKEIMKCMQEQQAQRVAEILAEDENHQVNIRLNRFISKDDL